MDIIEAFATKNRCYQVGARADHRHVPCRRGTVFTALRNV